MIIKYFSYWDYPTTHIDSFIPKEHEISYKVKLEQGIDKLKTNGEEMNLDILNQYSSLQEENIFPFLEEDIKFLEDKLEYLFPRAFKELLFLFGALCFRGLSIDLTKDFFSKEEALESIVRVLDQHQLELRNIYKKHRNKNISSIFLPIAHDKKIGHFTLISNEIEKGFVHRYDYLEQIPMVLEKDLFINTFYYNSALTVKVREKIDSIFCTNLKVVYLLTLLHKEIKKNSLFDLLEIIQTEDKITIPSVNENVRDITIIIVHDNLLHTNFTRDKFGEIALYSFEEIVNRREEVMEELSLNLQLWKYI